MNKDNVDNVVEDITEKVLKNNNETNKTQIVKNKYKIK